MTATPLADGRVLVVGGVGETTTELYDPPTGTWLPGGTLNQPRGLHVAVRLRDGRVLVAGSGRYGSPEQFNAEIFSPPYLFNGARPTISSAPATPVPPCPPRWALPLRGISRASGTRSWRSWA